MLIRITDKHTQKQISEAGKYDNSVSNIFTNLMSSKDIREWCMTDWSSLLAELGKPLVHMWDYESCPGVWKFYDTSREIDYTLYSDAHKKNAFKGTTIEFRLKDSSVNLSESEVKAAYDDLMNFINIKSHKRSI